MGSRLMILIVKRLLVTSFMKGMMSMLKKYFSINRIKIKDLFFVIPPLIISFLA